MTLPFGILLRFILAVVIGAGGAFGVAAVTASPKSSAVPGPQSSYQLTAVTGDQPAALFGITAIPDQAPVKLSALPDDQTLQLVAYAEPGSADRRAGLPPRLAGRRRVPAGRADHPVRRGPA